MRQLKAQVRRLLAALEPAAHIAAPRLDVPPVFIVGLPRVGSTLASILATRHLRCAFFSNLLMATPASPIATSRLLALLRPFDGVDDLANHHGETIAARAPSQGYRFWKHYITEGNGTPALLPGRLEPLRRTIATMQGLAGGPLVNKWQTNSLRIPLLAEVFPGAVFVEITRSMQQSAESILRARRQQPGGEAQWYSVRVPGIETDGLGPHEQIARQLVGLRAILDRDLSALPPERVMKTEYATICVRPNDWLEDLSARYRQATGAQLDLRRRFGGTLQARSQNAVSTSDSRRIADALSSAASISAAARPNRSQAPHVAADRQASPHSD